MTHTILIVGFLVLEFVAIFTPSKYNLMAAGLAAFAASLLF